MIQPIEPARPGKSDPVVVFVALKSPRLDDLSQILRTLRKRLPAVSMDDSPSGSDSTWVFELGGQRAAISVVPAPIPWDDLEGPCETAWWWPEAARALRRHTQHVIVALRGGSEDPIARHILLTQLVCAVSEHSDAVGIYWGNGTVVHEPQAFREEAEGLSPDNLTPYLWVDLRVQSNRDGTTQLLTTGLGAWGCMELECESCPWNSQELFNFACGVVEYLMRRGESIGDEETIGRDADEKITIRHRPSMWDRDTVMMLEFD